MSWGNWLITTALVLAGLAFIAQHQDAVREAFNELLLFLVRPLAVALDWVSQGAQRLAAFIRAQLQEEQHTEGGDPSAPAPQSVPTAASPGTAGTPTAVSPNAAMAAHPFHLSRFIGAIVMAGITVICAAVEVYLTKLTLAAMFGTAGNDMPQLASALDWMSAGALMTVSIFWGLVLIDMHRGTHLFPEGFLKRFKKPLVVMAWSSIAFSILTFAVMGIWRGRQLDTSAAVPAVAAASLEIPGAPTAATTPSSTTSTTEEVQSGFDQFAEVFFPAALTILTGLTLLVSFTGVIALFKYIGLLALGLMLAGLVALLLPLRIIEQIVMTIVGVMQHVVNLAARLGRGVVNTFGPPLTDLRRHLHAAFRRRLGLPEDPKRPGTAPDPQSDAHPAASAPQPKGDSAPPTSKPGGDTHSAPPPPEPTDGGEAPGGEPKSVDLDDWNWKW